MRVHILAVQAQKKATKSPGLHGTSGAALQKIHNLRVFYMRIQSDNSVYFKQGRENMDT